MREAEGCTVKKNVIECNCMTGDYSMLLEVLFENTMELDLLSRNYSILDGQRR